MEKRIVKIIIKEKQEQILKIKLQERPIFLEDKCNYVFVGIRRAGKSFLMFQRILSLIKKGEALIENILYINFEDERIANIKSEELGVIIDSYRELYDYEPIVFLDEIQNVDGWEKFARRLADSGYRLYITGSNAKMLSRDIATTLGGRFIIKEVFPFSFSEFLQIKGVELDKNWEFGSVRNKVVQLWEEYFYFGGLAESFDLVDKRGWLNSLYQKVLFGDIVARNAIRNEEAIRLLSKKLAESVMQPTTQSRLQHIVSSSGAKASRSTIIDFLKYMRDAYLIFGISNYTDSITEKESSQKRYFFDNGILNIFLVDGNTKLLENVVAIDLLKEYGLGDLFYYNRNVEVDFFVPREKLAIQVSFDISDDATFNRETRALVKLSKAFELQRAVIITSNEESEVEVDGLTIEVIPVWKWVLAYSL
ncbi:MAG: ATP-binding protein [Rikenellaceae bacterium]